MGKALAKVMLLFVGAYGLGLLYRIVATDLPAYRGRPEPEHSQDEVIGRTQTHAALVVASLALGLVLAKAVRRPSA